MKIKWEGLCVGFRGLGSKIPDPTRPSKYMDKVMESTGNWPFFAKSNFGISLCTLKFIITIINEKSINYNNWNSAFLLNFNIFIRSDTCP